MFQLQPKTYNWTYLLRLPFECQPVCTTIVVLQKLITGLVNVLWILVEASFIDTLCVWHRARQGSRQLSPG